MSPMAMAQDTKLLVLDAASLQSTLTGLGYEPKVLNQEVGKEKFELAVMTEALKIPIAAEISSSTNYIWLTTNLGLNRTDLNFEELLKSNSSIQPCQFYITKKGNLMMGVALDNRGVSPAVLRRNIDMISKNVGETKALWLKS